MNYSHKNTGQVIPIALITTLFVIVVNVAPCPAVGLTSSAKTNNSANVTDSANAVSHTNTTNPVDMISPVTPSGYNSISPSTNLTNVPRRVIKDKVKLISVYNLDGKLITGAVISEDRNKIVVAQVEGSKIVVNTYPTKQLALRTLSVANKLEYLYDIDLAKYFVSRTGDFVDDVDDFIQAIRYYEKAKYLLSNDTTANSNGGSIDKNSNQNNKKMIDAIDAAIAKIKADRKVWISEVKSRAALKKLEFEATFEEKFKKLQEENKQEQDKINKISDDFKSFKGEFYNFSDSINWQLDRIGRAVAANESFIRDSWRRPPAFVPVEPRYYYNPPYLFNGSVGNRQNYNNGTARPPATNRSGSNSNPRQQPPKRTTRSR